MDPQNPFLSTAGKQQEPDQDESQEVLAERSLADAGESQAMYNYSQKLLEQKERELMESIAANYGRIREVERELGNLQLQLKLTSGPKKHALELLRKKIEVQNEKVAYVRARHTAAKAAFERLDGELKQEEAIKEQLCGELNTLVQQAARAQMEKLEELKATLEGLYSGVTPKPAGHQTQPAGQPSASGGTAAAPGAPATSHQQGAAAGAIPQSEPAADQERRRQEAEAAERQRQEAEEAAKRKQEAAAAERRRREVEAEAAAARSRHVSLNSPAATKAAGASSPRSQGGLGRVGSNGALSEAGAGTGTGAAPAAARLGAPGAGAAAAPSRSKPSSNGPPVGGQGGRFAGFDT